MAGTSLYNGVQLVDGPNLRNVEKIDLGYMPIMNHMMATGMQVDISHFERMDKILTQDMEDLTEKVKSVTGHYTNLGSPEQVSDLLFKKLKLKQLRPKMTSSGDRESTDHEVLVAIQHDHESVPLIIEYKEVEKLRGTYVRPIPKLAKRTALGRWYLYPNLGQTRVPSGRNNCKEPNLLAMPNRTARGRQVCEGFICDDGWVYLSVDVSQLEPRVAAHRSQDPSLLRIYRNNEDIYSDFAIKAFKLQDLRYTCGGYSTPYGERGNICDNIEHTSPNWHYPTVHKKDHRFPAKTCTLASFYRVSAGGLLEQMPVICANCHKEATKHDCGKFQSFWTENMCQDLINAFGLTYEKVIEMEMLDDKRVRRHGMTWDMWGRIIHSAAVRSVHTWVVSASLRELGNFPIQSGGRGIVKLGQTEIFDNMLVGNLLEICNPVLDIHDEILTVCREDETEAMGQFMIDIFENCCPLTVPIKAGMAKAQSWGTLPK